MAEEAMNVPFGSILVWTLVMKMASMFCGRDLNTSLCQMMEGFIRIIFLFWCLFVCFFWGGALLPKSMGIFWNWRPSAFFWTFRLFRWLPTNPWNSSWESEMSGLMHLRTHILPGILPPKWPHENFWMSCLSLLLHVGFWCDNIPLKYLWKPLKVFPFRVQKCPKMLFRQLHWTDSSQQQNTKKNLHISSIREDVSENDFSPPEWIDFSMRSVFQLNIVDPLNLEVRGRFKGAQLISTSWEKLKWSVDERSFLPL